MEISIKTFTSALAATLFLSAATLSPIALAGDAEDALNEVVEKTTTCQSYDINASSYDIDTAIMDCLFSVIGLSTIAQGSLEADAPDMGFIYQVLDTAALSSMMASALYFKQAGGVTSDACTSAGTAISYYDTNPARTAQEKSEFPAQALAKMCRDKGISTE